jgi:hypothetical protein
MQWKVHFEHKNITLTANYTSHLDDNIFHLAFEKLHSVEDGALLSVTNINHQSVIA